jgi:hypothetical protein
VDDLLLTCTAAASQAIELFTEGLKHRDGLPRALLALAKLYLAAGDTAACQAQCVALLKADADNQEAAIMLAQIMFHQVGALGRALEAEGARQAVPHARGCVH